MKKKKGLFQYQVYTIEKSFKHHLVEWIAAFLSILGAILNAQLNIYGFYIFMLGNFMWIAFAVKHRHWGLFAANLVFFVLNVYGVWVWMKSPLLA